jgi:hypothetical protein
MSFRSASQFVSSVDRFRDLAMDRWMSPVLVRRAEYSLASCLATELLPLPSSPLMAMWGNRFTVFPGAASWSLTVGC